MITFLLCILLLVGGHVTHAQDEAGDLLGRINNLRASLGRAPYALNGALSGAAQDQAQWIVNTGNVSHTRGDGSGPRSRALAYGFGTTDVSENIYGGMNASVNDAWAFWVNSGIHYRGLVNERFQQVGIGIARGGWGAAFVLVFGNPGGPPPAPPAPPPGSSSGSSAPAAVPEPPSYVVGLDPNGNIMHEVQPGDTLGDILLIYGYTWDMLPYIQQINGIGDVRDLEIGSILLVPPYYGTYTPTPNTELPTAVPSPTFQYPTPFPEDPLFALSHTPPPSATPPPDALMVAAVPTGMGTPLAPAAAGTQIAALPTADVGMIEAAQVEQGQGIPTWLLIGIGLQVVIVLGAAIEFSRRLRRK
jgi:hypothetical protein